MTLISELIDVPERVNDGDFVLKLTQGVAADRVERTVAEYVPAGTIPDAFADALGLIGSAIASGNSQATYLHGSFGSGKSHFMAILHLILQGDPRARSLAPLHQAIDHWDTNHGGAKTLLVPLHFLGATSMDAQILGGYVAQVQRLHPEAPLPPVFLSDEILAKELPGMRAHLGDAAFVEAINGGAGDGDGDEWGEFSQTWTIERVEQALLDGADDQLRNDLAAAYIGAFRQATTTEARSTGKGLIDLDNGLAAISQHAEQLGYDAVVLFLDELILWLASYIGDLAFVQREAQKLTKLVEAGNLNRPVPIISFVARQRDLNELVGEHILGSEKVSLADTLELQSGRFSQITLEDRNLPAIAAERILKPVSADAADALRAAIDDALAGRDEIRSALLTRDSDVELFRTVYPFSPALVQALVALSEALQRERTALKIMQQLLSERRDTLELGQLVPVGDLWDVVAAGAQPFSTELRAAFETAKRLYRTKLRPMLCADHGVDDDSAASNPAFVNDDRLIKTVLLAALVERVEAFVGLDAKRLVALNWGSVTSPIPGRETQIVTNKLRSWSAMVPELQVGDDPISPTVSITLVDVDTEAITAKAIETFDNAGARRKALRDLVDADMDARLGDTLAGTVTHEWRGTPRSIDVSFGNIRDAAEVPDAALRSSGATPKVVIDFPFDDHGRSPDDDLERLDRFADTNGATTTVCWLPSFLNEHGLKALQVYVALNQLLASDQRYEQQTAHLSDTQRRDAKPLLDRRRGELRSQLEGALRAAYGVVGESHRLIDSGRSLSAHFRSLDPAIDIRPTTDPTLGGAFDQIADQLLSNQYPGHPRFDGAVSRAHQRTTWAELTRALGTDDGRIIVESKNRAVLRNVANNLELGTMHESHFQLGRSWEQRLDRHIAAADHAGSPLSVADLRALIDTADGGPRGLPDVLADLVIATVAAQTDQSIVYGGQPVAFDGGSALPGDAVLRAEVLPDDATWAEACKRASLIFGVNASPKVSAPEAARFAESIRAAAQPWVAWARELVDALGAAERSVGSIAAGERTRTAAAAKALVEAVAAQRDAHDVVELLASAEIPTSAAAMAKSLTTADSVANDLQRNTNWELLGGAGSEIVGPLRSALIADELVTPYEPEMRRLTALATKAVVAPPVVTPPVVPPVVDPPVVVPPVVAPLPVVPPVDGAKMVSNLDELRDVGDQLAEMVREGRRVEVTWRTLD